MVRANFTAKIMRVKLVNNYYWLHYNWRKLSNWLASACGLGLNSRPWHSRMFPICMDFRSVNNINFCSDNISEVPFFSSQPCYPVFLMEHARPCKWAWFISQHFIKIKCSSNLVISNNISYIGAKSFTYTTYSYRWQFFFFSSKPWSSQLWTQFKQLHIEAWKSLDFNGVWTRDLAIPVQCSNQLSYEATDVGSWSFVGSNKPVRNDTPQFNIWSISYITSHWFFCLSKQLALTKMPCSKWVSNNLTCYH